MANNSPRFTTPKGKAVFPHLGRPDTKFHDLGIYKADILVPVEEAKDLMDKLCAFYKNETGAAANKFDNTMFKLDVDEDGEPTGNVMFKLRVKNRMTKAGDLWDRKPKMFDAQLTPCPQANPYGGTEMAVNFEAYAWNAGGKQGVSLQPVAIQITNLVDGKSGGGDAGGFGFEATDGFTAEPAAEAFAPVPASNEDTDGDF